ncbi:MAG: methyltransferase domain-containing protein [Anaerolineales bacterium]|nr:methyltransferase domain-containing protein [Anaerolineales bacterium]
MRRRQTDPKYAAASTLTVGMDPDQNALRIARANSPTTCAKGILHPRNRQTPPFSKETFDIAPLPGRFDEWNRSMVHALDETRRTLKSDGILIDLRPWKIAGRLRSLPQDTAGQLDDTPIVEPTMKPPSAPCVRGGIARLVCHKEHEEEFSFFYYWDTPSEMKEFMDEEWEGLLRKWKTRSTTCNRSGQQQMRMHK